MSRIVLQSTATGGHQYEWYNDFNGQGSGVLALYDRTSGNVPLTFSSVGNVGFGTSLPSWKLDIVAGASNGLSVLTANQAPWGFRLKNATATGSGLQIFQSDTGYVTLYNNYGLGASITMNQADGNVGIGLTNPQSLLHLYRGPSRGLVQDGMQIGRPGASDCYAFLSYGGGSSGEPGDTAYFGSVYAGGTKGSICLRVSDGTSHIDALLVNSLGNVGIGTTSPTQKLSVNGTVRAKEVIVDTGWSDYVFDESYKLKALSETEAFIKAEKHLPGIPSASEVAEKGISLGDMQAKLLAKIEELTLHMISLQKENQNLRQRLDRVEAVTITK